MDAYCEHLGAHLGLRRHGGRGPDPLPLPRLGVERPGPQRLHPVRGPPQHRQEDQDHAGRRAQRVDLRLARRRGPRRRTSTCPDIFTGFGDGATADDYYPLCEHARLYETRLELHPQYVLENGVDFAHFKYVHQVPIVPLFTKQEFEDPIALVDFTITFDESDTGGKIEDINSGVNAFNCGLGLAVTKSWGMIDNRTASAVTPVDDETCDVRFSVWIGRKPGDDRDHSESADRHARGRDRAVRGRHRDLVPPEVRQPRRPVARRVPRLHRAAQVGRAVLPRDHDSNHPCNHREPRMSSISDRPIRVFQVATGNVGTEMIKRLGPHPDLELVGVHCYSPDKIGRDVGELAGIGPVGVIATGTVEEIIAAEPDVVTFHGVFPDEDLYVRVLEAGIDIVTTADWITGHHRDANHPHPSGRKVSEVLAGGLRARRRRRSTAPA